MNKECQACGKDQPREDMAVCDCNEIMCRDSQCKIDHLFQQHWSPRPLEDDEWDDLDG